MKCPKCGYYMDDQLMICPQCGASVSDAAGAGESGAETFGASDGGSPKKQHKGLIIGLILLIAAIAVGLGIYYYRITYICREIHLNKQYIELLVGDSDALNAEFVPETTKNKILTWESSDENVATVDDNGIVTGVGSGECTITASSSNGKTDVCSVLVKSLIDIQKESVASVVDYIKKNNPTDENGVAVAKIADIDDEHSFALGSIGDDLVLVYRDELEVDSVDIGVKYTTYINVESGNIETSEVVQDNQVTISGYPVTTTMRGSIPLAEYNGGGVTIDSIESTLEGMEVNDSLQKTLDSGARGCYDQFKAFLESHPALGCTMENFGFTAPERTEEEEAEDSASSSATVVEEIAEPGADSSVSSVESEAESIVESVAEEPVAESAAEEAPVAVIGGIAAVESAVEAAESQVEDMSSGIAAAASQAEDAADAVIAGAQSQVEDISSGIAAAASQVEDAADAAIAGAESKVEDMGGEVEAAASQVEAAADAAIAEVESQLESVETAIDDAESALEEAVGAVLPAVEDAESAPLEIIEDDAAVESVSDWETIVIDEAESALETVSEEVQDIESAVEGIAAEVEENIDSTGADLAGVAGAAAAAGAAAVDEAADDMAGTVSAVEEAASAAGDAAASEVPGADAIVVEEPAGLAEAESSAESITESMIESIVEAVIEELEELGENLANGTEAEPDSPNSSRSDSDATFRSITDSLGGAASKPPFGAVIML